MNAVYVFLCAGFALVLPWTISAQGLIDLDTSLEAEAELEAALPELPDPGLTPDSPFFIFEQLIETVSDTFTFNPQAKAKRQGERALERIAEVKAMLAQKGVSARGLNVALQKIEDHANKAAANVDDPALAKEIDATFETQQVLLKKIIENKKNSLREEHKERKDALHRQWTEKLLTRSDDEAEDLENELFETEAEAETLETLLENVLVSTEQALQDHERTLEHVLTEKDQQYEQFERDVRAAIKTKKKAMNEHFKELRSSLKEKERALKEQLKEAIELGEDGEIEQLTEEFSTSVQMDAALDLDMQTADMLVAGGEANIEVFLLSNSETDPDILMEHEQSFLDQVSQGADLIFKAKKKARELRLDAEEKALNLKGKKLGYEIVKRRQECLDMDVSNLGQCIAERAQELQTELANVLLEQKVIVEEQTNLSDESNAEERQFDESLMMRKRALEAFQSLDNAPERLLDASQKFSERAREEEKQWQEKKELLKEERRTSKENLRERMKEGKETIRTEWQEFLKTDFDPEELEAMQEERRMEQKELLEEAKEERTEIREEFKEGMRDLKDERGMMQEPIQEEKKMMQDDVETDSSEKQRLEEEMRMFLEKRDELLREQQKQMDEKMKERQMMDENSPEKPQPLPSEKSYPSQDRGEDLSVKQLLPRYPSRDIPNRRPDEPAPSSSQRPVDENPPLKLPADENPPLPSDDEAKEDVQSGDKETSGGVQFEFEGKEETTGGR